MGHECLSSGKEIIDMDVDVESRINLSHKDVRVLLLHEFLLGHKATEAASNICSTMG